MFFYKGSKFNKREVVGGDVEMDGQKNTLVGSVQDKCSV